MRKFLTHLHSVRPVIGLSIVSLLLGPWAALPARAAAPAPTSAPQVLLAVTNSESMDGSTAGAIMTGSGTLTGGAASLSSSSSPVNFAIPAGFVPPLNAGNGVTAPYSATCADGVNQCDNSPSRMNMAKTAITQVLQNYGDVMNFGLYTYKTGAPTLYQTWLYLMSLNGGFTFTNVASAATTANPCFNFAAASATVNANCGQIAPLYTAKGITITNFQYMNIALSSDDATVNDVLYTTSALPSVYLNYGTITPPTPFPPNRTLAQYNAGGVSVAYQNVTPGSGSNSTSPTNAGYVPYSTEVMYVQRGFGYGASQDATTGSTTVAMTNTIAAFNAALAPETNNGNTNEMKAVAGQSAIGGLLNGARTYLNGLTSVACQKQYVVLLTDGLPTLDLNNNPWPPLGTTSGNNYGVTATFSVSGAIATTNDTALTDTITSLNNLKTAGISTYIIGLGAGVNSTTNPTAANVLKAMAMAGGTTDFFPATDTASLNSAFQTIAQQIYSQSSLSAPIAPISVQGGSAFEYALSSDPSPPAGYVNAFTVTSAGIPAQTASWEAGALMTTATRTAALKSTYSDGTIKSLSNIDTAAFNLTVTACVPNTGTIVNYLINPAYTYSSCNYLAGRTSGIYLTKFSTQNSAKYVGPPTASSGVTASGYVSYVTATKNRPPMLMFTNSDGFLYAINPTSGALLWAWTPRSVLAKMQNYSKYMNSNLLNGGFTVVDAKDSVGAWGSYVVGSAQSGAEHFSIKLASDGTPSSVVYDTVVAGATAPGDVAGTTGATPFRQPPQFVTVNGNVNAIYVYTAAGTSTLVEVNVATGLATSASLAFTPSSALYVDSLANRLWAGSSLGSVYATTLTGAATTDAAKFSSQMTMVNPADNVSTVAPVLYVGYTEISGIPYVYAVTKSLLTVFGVTSSSWKPMFASTPTAGYLYKLSTNLFNVSAKVPAMTSGSVMSDLPRVDGKVLLLPVFAAPASICGTGTGYYDFFDMTSGAFPKIPYTLSGNTITTNMQIGPGPAYTPSVTLTKTGLALNTGSSGNLKPTTPLLSQGNPALLPIGWRVLD